MRRSCWMVFLPVLTELTFAQLSYPNCIAGWEWSYNTLGQNPCAIFAYLAAQGGNFTVDSYHTGVVYSGPSSSNGEGLYQCNTVAYSLSSACASCQGGSWGNWSTWSSYCAVVAWNGTLVHFHFRC
ncbi:hypothetical protein F5148DRAFT_1224337, partial [Russula earlei]